VPPLVRPRRSTSVSASPSYFSLPSGGRSPPKAVLASAARGWGRAQLGGHTSRLTTGFSTNVSVARFSRLTLLAANHQILAGNVHEVIVSSFSVCAAVGMTAAGSDPPLHPIGAALARVPDNGSTLHRIPPEGQHGRCKLRTRCGRPHVRTSARVRLGKWPGSGLRSAAGRRWHLRARQRLPLAILQSRQRDLQRRASCAARERRTDFALTEFCTEFSSSAEAPCANVA